MLVLYDFRMGLGFWSKGCSFMGFLIEREDFYLVSRFRVLRNAFICMIFVNPWLFFFCFSSKVVKGESFMRFSWKMNCFSSFKYWFCMISVWGFGLWSKDCSFMSF